MTVARSFSLPLISSARYYCILCITFSCFLVAQSSSPLWKQEFVYPEEPKNDRQRKRPLFCRKQPGHPIKHFVKGGSSATVPTGEKDLSDVLGQQNPPPPIIEKLFQFRKTRGKLNIDLGKTSIWSTKPPSPPHIPERRVLGLSLVLSEGVSNNNVTTIVPASNTTSRQVITKALTSLSKPRSQPRRKTSDNNFEMKMSIDFFSACRLLQNFATASVALCGAFMATLRMLAPMIVARRCLAYVAYVIFDHYNGRVLRKTVTKQVEFFNKYDLKSAIRASGRSLIQILAMGIVGKLAQIVLRKSPCWMPPRICNYWYGIIWISGVLGVGRLVGMLMTSRLLFFKIQPYFARHAQASPLHIFTRPWHILQWMKDPEEWISNIVKLSHSDKYLPFQADSLLFPSTWPPLQFLMNLALVHAIQRTLPGTPPRALLRYFCIQSVMYEEWYRLLFRERRVVLGAVLSVLSFLATAKFVHDAAKVDRLAIVMVFPALVAGLVSCWMNVLLVNERVLASKKRSPKIISKRRSTRSGNVVNDNWSSQWGSESRSVWDEN